MEAETLHSKGVKFALTQFEANQIKVVEVNWIRTHAKRQKLAQKLGNGQLSFGIGQWLFLCKKVKQAWGTAV